MWQSAQATPLRAWMPWLHSLELRMLRLEHRGAGLRVRPVVEVDAVRKLVGVVVALDLLDVQAVVPGVEQGRLRPAVVLDVALAADEGAHLLARRVGVRVVRRRSAAAPPSVDALEMRDRRGAGGERLDPANETRARDPQLHARRVVTVDAAHRMGALDVLEGGRRSARRHRIRRSRLHHLGMGFLIRELAHASNPAKTSPAPSRR